MKKFIRISGLLFFYRRTGTDHFRGSVMNKRKKILIVDDASFMRTAAASMLSEVYDTVNASSGEEALKLCVSEKPDLILSDLIMPGMTGLELQKCLREQIPDPPPIIFMSADESEENEVRGLENGAMDFIRKPFNRAVLLRRIGNIIRQMEKLRLLRQEASTDPMTGLLNKGKVREVLAETCAISSGTLMMVDLDNFKPVNDLFGHAMGDKVLICFADILRSVFRTDDIIGRVGGDEFIVFCLDIRDETIIQEKIRRTNELLRESAAKLMGEGHGIPLGVSAGAVPVPDEGKRFSELSEKADRALYYVKQNGKHGCEIFHSVPAEPKPDEGETVPAAALRSIRTLLEERSRRKGAYEVGFEQFQCIYRFLVRSVENYHRPVELLLFILSGPDLQNAADRFGEVLKHSLRRSDIYTRHGSGQYLALLNENPKEKTNIVLDRILHNWNEAGYAPDIQIKWESTPLSL